MSTADRTGSILLVRFAHQWRKKLIAAPKKDIPNGDKLVGICIVESHIINKPGPTRGLSFRTHAEIGETCDMTPSAVKAAIANLVKQGFLIVERQGNNRPNITRLSLPRATAVEGTDTAVQPTATPVRPTATSVSLHKTMKETTIETTNKPTTAAPPDSLPRADHPAHPSKAIGKAEADLESPYRAPKLRLVAGL